MKQTSYPGIYENEGHLYTKNLIPSSILFGESILKLNDLEYRQFDPIRSKLAAGIMKKISKSGIKEDDIVLYLGAAHGYTVSFLSDIIGSKGVIFAVDSAYKVFRSLFHVSNLRHNIVPIYADASKPVSYIKNICAVDVIYQDVAQKEQAEIFDANYSLYAKDGALGMLVVKTRSIDVAEQPAKVIDSVKKILHSLSYTILECKNLEPYEKDHALMLVVKGEIIEQKSKEKKLLKRKSSTHTA